LLRLRRTFFDVGAAVSFLWLRGNLVFRAGLGYPKVSRDKPAGACRRGLEIDASSPMLQMVLRIDLPEGSFLAGVGFGNLAPTGALKLVPLME
jgi:N-hydroxyarylamine O-acetyltransferase